MTFLLGTTAISKPVQRTDRGETDRTYTYHLLHAPLKPTYPAVSLQGLHQIVVRLCVKVKPFLVHVLEVQIFVGRARLLSLFPGRSSLVGGSLQVVFVVHFDGARQHIVHHHQSDVDASGLDAVQSIELGQQRAWILVQVLRGERQLTSKCSELKVKLLISEWQHYVANYLTDIIGLNVFLWLQNTYGTVSGSF